MDKSKRVYDYLIYGGSPAGIIFALRKSSIGKKILLINHYGFLGGSISSAFNCLQAIKYPEKSLLYNELLSRLRSEKHGILYSDEYNIIINPESIKMQLFLMIKSSGTDLLFHVNPINYQLNKDNIIELELAAKEGRIKVSGETLIDASENQLIKQLDMDVKFYEVLKRTNIFITRPSKLEFNGYHDVLHAIKLIDNRYFVSLIGNCSSSAIINNYMDETIYTFNSIITAAGSRIQLMPSENYLFYEFTSNEVNNSRVLSIEDFLGRNFLPNEQLLKAAELERYLNERG